MDSVGTIAILQLQAALAVRMHFSPAPAVAEAGGNAGEATQRSGGHCPRRA